MSDAKFLYNGQDVFVCGSCGKQIFYSKDFRGEKIAVTYHPSFEGATPNADHNKLHVCAKDLSTKKKPTPDAVQITAFNLDNYKRKVVE